MSGAVCRPDTVKCLASVEQPTVVIKFTAVLQTISFCKQKTEVPYGANRLYLM